MLKNSKSRLSVPKENSNQKILCACLNVKRNEAIEFLKKPGNSVDGLVEKTGMGTKCAACLLDLDVIIENVDTKNELKKRDDSKSKLLNQTSFGMGSVDRVDSGFFVCNNDINTIIRLANFNPLFREGAEATPHQFKLMIMEESGRVAAKKTGNIRAGEQININLGKIKNCPNQGWFLLSVIPLGPGYYGTLRPQVLLIGSDWASACHTQFHGFASNKVRRVAVGIKSTNGKTWCKVCVINGENKSGEVTLRAQGSTYKSCFSFTLPSKGSKIINLDSVYQGLPEDEQIVLNVDSKLLTRKYLINTQPDGSWGADHFPTFP